MRVVEVNLHAVLLLSGGEIPLCLSAGLSLMSREGPKQCLS